MRTENFWLSLKALAAFLEGSREESEQTLDQLQSDLLSRPPTERREYRHALILIVAQLSRLEVRLNEHDGPSGTML